MSEKVAGEPPHQEIYLREGQGQPPMAAEASPTQTPQLNTWKHGLCGCFDNTTLCIITWLVPCVTFGEIAKALGRSCVVYGLLFAVPILNWVLWVKQRGELRQRRGIPGGVIGDLCIICWCSMCAMSQEGMEAHHMQAEELARATGGTAVVMSNMMQAPDTTVAVITYSNQPAPSGSGAQAVPAGAQGYPPPTQGYPPQQGYPPPQGYPPQGYPPPADAQGAYLPPKGDYPPQQSYPPPQSYPPAGAQAQPVYPPAQYGASVPPPLQNPDAPPSYEYDNATY